MAAEKTQKAVLDSLEGFDTGKLKHTTTQERNPLPDKSGNCLEFLGEKNAVAATRFVA